MLVMVVFFIAFRWIHLSTPLIRLFLLVLILLLMPTLNFLPVWFALSLLRFRLPSRLPMMFILWMVAMMVVITTIMATIQRINIIGSREGSRNRRRLKANQTGKKFRVGIKSNISTNRNNLISGVDRCIHLNAMKKTTITSINRQTIKI